MKAFAGILVSSVTMEQRHCTRMFRHCLVEGVIYEFVVVMVADYIGNRNPSVEIQDHAQIKLMEMVTVRPILEL